MVNLSSVRFFRLSCDLSGDDFMILEENLNDSFAFSGFTEEERLLVRAVTFRTADVAFVPRETFEVFPNLNIISVHSAELDYLSADFFRFFPKNHKITGFDFYNCKIDKIDPDVWQYIKNGNMFRLRENVCLNESFTDPNVLFKKIQKCFKNFNRSYLYTNKLIKGVAEQLRDTKLSCLK
jgi:hypothetical protein